jgi:hypothetical protein
MSFTMYLWQGEGKIYVVSRIFYITGWDKHIHFIEDHEMNIQAKSLLSND